MSASEPTEEEVRAALEEEMKRVRVEDVLLQSVVSLVNLGARRAGLAPELEAERDPEQLRVAVDAVRALMPVLERIAPEQASAIQDALSQLQLAFVRAGGADEAMTRAAGPPPEGEAPPPQQQQRGAEPERPGPARSSGRLWIPGQ